MNTKTILIVAAGVGLLWWSRRAAAAGAAQEHVVASVPHDIWSAAAAPSMGVAFMQTAPFFGSKNQ